MTGCRVVYRIRVNLNHIICVGRPSLQAVTYNQVPTFLEALSYAPVFPGWNYRLHPSFRLIVACSTAQRLDWRITKDPSGRLIQGAHITATNERQGTIREGATGADGSFTLSNLETMRLY